MFTPLQNVGPTGGSMPPQVGGGFGMAMPSQQGSFMPRPGYPALGPNLHGASPAPSFMEPGPKLGNYGQQPSLMPGPLGGGYPGIGASPPPSGMAPPAAPLHPTPPIVAPRRGGCQEDFAEDQCLKEQECGDDEHQPNTENHRFLGIDVRPFLPLALWLSTGLGGIWMVFVQVPLFSSLVDVPANIARPVFATLYVLTVVTMAYSALADPGQVPEDVLRNLAMREEALMNNESLSETDEPKVPMPQRAHKSWQYERPIRRYDHYCKWLTNVIGLFNHREFFVMVIGLAMIAVLGTAVDVMLAYSMFKDGMEGLRPTSVAVVLHLGYSVFLMGLAGPILRIHVGLISRNELAAEWTRNSNYIVSRSKKGRNVPVADLSDDEHNELFDKFKYDKSRNRWDRGFVKNWFLFWFAPRLGDEALGEF